MAVKVGISKGTRDFNPAEMAKRNYIFDTIRSVFTKYGYQSIETPSFELLDTLTGKYGDEGDQLIFKILNSGDYLAKADEGFLKEKKSAQLTKSISKKALRYDLTVPFARFVVQHRNEITFPFKRFQIQPVWRADRPAKGRYQEFYQCDADVVGSDSLLYEIEFVQIFDEVLTQLNLPSFTIKINNRKVLSGIAEVIGEQEKLTAITVAIDKLDKIGKEGVLNELAQRGITKEAIDKLDPLFSLPTDFSERLNLMRSFLKDSAIGLKGIEELEFVFDQLNVLGLQRAQLEFDNTLARGLNYYTGAIFEVKVNGVEMGSICGGGRYDDLTGVFGLSGISGVGISFGADRIYDVLNELKLFPASTTNATQLLFVNFGAAEASNCMALLKKVREAGVSAEIYPDSANLKKQFKYANDKEIPLVAVIGANEMEEQKVVLKNMASGEQTDLNQQELVSEVLRLSLA